MTCDEAKVLLHGLLDGELEVARAREVEAHVAACPRCAAELAQFRQMRRAMSGANMKFAAPPALRGRIDTMIPAAPVRAPAPSRRLLLKGFTLGAALSAAAAAGVAFVIVGADRDRKILDEAVSAHRRSLQPGRLTDVASSERQTVKPWFDGKLATVPPVIDLTAQGFALAGGRLDTIDGKAVAAIVYRRGVHVINLFVAAAATAGHTAAQGETVQGFNTQRWNDRGLHFTAISDIGDEELREFHTKFEEGLRAGA